MSRMTKPLGVLGAAIFLGAVAACDPVSEDGAESAMAESAATGTDEDLQETKQALTICQGLFHQTNAACYDKPYLRYQALQKCLSWGYDTYSLVNYASCCSGGACKTIYFSCCYR